MVDFLELIEEFVLKLENQGHTEDYIDGALHGYQFAHEFYLTLVTLSNNKEKYIKQEWNVKT